MKSKEPGIRTQGLSLDVMAGRFTVEQQTVEVRFRNNYRRFARIPGALGLQQHDRVVVGTPSGNYIGTVISVCKKARCRKDPENGATAPGFSILRRATASELQEWLGVMKQGKDIPPELKVTN